MYVSAINVAKIECSSSGCALTVTVTINSASADDVRYDTVLYARDLTRNWTPLTSLSGSVGSAGEYMITFAPLDILENVSFLLGAKDASEEYPDIPTAMVLVEPETAITSTPTSIVPDSVKKTTGTVGNTVKITSAKKSDGINWWAVGGLAAAGAGMLYVLSSEERTRSLSNTMRHSYNRAAPMVDRGIRRAGGWMLDVGLPVASKGVRRGIDAGITTGKSIYRTVQDKYQELQEYRSQREIERAREVLNRADDRVRSERPRNDLRRSGNKATPKSRSRSSSRKRPVPV